MNQNLFKFLMFLTLKHFSRALDVDCSFGAVGWSVVGSVYTCTVKSSQISLSNSLITGFTGAHTSNSNSNVQGFFMYLNCHHIKFIPTNIDEYFPNVIAISIHGCGLEMLNGSELNAYKNLQGIQLPNNKIERIPANLFSQTPQVKSIRLEGNRIKRIGANLFEPLQAYLGDLDLSKNDCVNLSGTSASQIALAINHIKIYCVDTEDPEKDPPMSLEEINYNLKSKNEKLQLEIDELKKKLETVENELKNKTENVEFN